jgi:hypothetical protein
MLLLLPLAQAAAEPPSPEAAPIVPVLTLTIQPPILKVRSNPNDTVVAGFNGTASVDKMAGVRCVVTLTSATDVAWVSQISPSTMVFTNEAPQNYRVDVIVPVDTPTSQGNLRVTGRAVANGLQSIAEVEAIIDVTGPVKLNLTGANRTQAGGARPAATFGGGLSGSLTIGAVAAVAVAVPAAAIIVYRRRRPRAYVLEG